MTAHLLSILDLSPHEVVSILDHAADIKRSPRGFDDYLTGRTLLMLFAKPSMRTRVSFEVAMTQLGGHAIAYGLEESTLGQKESFADFGAVAARYVDAIVARLHAQDDLARLASRSRVPVINGLTDHEHPCQALGDLLTIAERGALRGARLAYVGDARNNVTHSLLLAGAMVGMRVKVACPPTMEPDAAVLSRARELAADAGGGASVRVLRDPREAVADAEYVYTDTWMSYHIGEAERPRRERALTPYRVDEALMAAAPPGARFLHCLPATRGEEVTDGVLDSPASLVLEQAENRLHAAKAVLLHLLRPTLASARVASAPLSQR